MATKDQKTKSTSSGQLIFGMLGWLSSNLGLKNLKHHLKTLPLKTLKILLFHTTTPIGNLIPSLRGDLRSSNVRTSAARSTLRCVAACLQRGCELRARRSSDEAEWLCYIHDAANFESACFDVQSLQGRQSRFWQVARNSRPARLREIFWISSFKTATAPY